MQDEEVAAQVDLPSIRHWPAIPNGLAKLLDTQAWTTCALDVETSIVELSNLT